MKGDLKRNKRVVDAILRSIDNYLDSGHYRDIGYMVVPFQWSTLLADSERSFKFGIRVDLTKSNLRVFEESGKVFFGYDLRNVRVSSSVLDDASLSSILSDVVYGIMYEDYANKADSREVSVLKELHPIIGALIDSNGTSCTYLSVCRLPYEISHILEGSTWGKMVNDRFSSLVNSIDISNMFSLKKSAFKEIISNRNVVPFIVLDMDDGNLKFFNTLFPKNISDFKSIQVIEDDGMVLKKFTKPRANRIYSNIPVSMLGIYGSKKIVELGTGIKISLS